MTPVYIGTIWFVAYAFVSLLGCGKLIFDTWKKTQYAPYYLWLSSWMAVLLSLGVLGIPSIYLTWLGLQSLR